MGQAFLRSGRLLLLLGALAVTLCHRELLDWIQSSDAGHPFLAVARAAIPALLERTKDEDKQVQIYAHCALAVLADGPHSHVTALAEALNDKNVEVRGSAAYALGELGSLARSAVPALTTALKDKD